MLRFYYNNVISGTSLGVFYEKVSLNSNRNFTTWERKKTHGGIIIYVKIYRQGRAKHKEPGHVYSQNYNIFRTTYYFCMAFITLCHSFLYIRGQYLR